MTNEDKINEIINTMKSEAADLVFCFDAATDNAVRFACGWMADWKDEQIKQVIEKDIKENARLRRRLARLHTQIDRMKCCYNCENWRDGLCDHVGGDVMADFVCDNWTMKGGGK